MTRLLLDTSVLVDAERGRSWVEQLGDDDDVAIAAVTLAELHVGVLLASARRRPDRSAFVGQVVESLPVIDYDVRVAAVHAELLAAVRCLGRPRGAHDLMIAATARATDRIVLTGDTTAFVGLPGVRHRVI